MKFYIIFLSIVILLTSCQTLKKTGTQVAPLSPSETAQGHPTQKLQPQPQSKASEPQQSLPVKPLPEVVQPSDSIQSTEPSVPSLPPQLPKMVFEESAKVAIILGPGGLRSFAHIGVLQEIQKQKVPIKYVVGLEMGALVGAIFAHKGQAYDVEWQMMKLKEDQLLKKSLLKEEFSPLSVKSLDSFLIGVFAQDRAEQAKIPFACPSFHLQKQLYSILNRGSIAQMMSYCLPFYPLFEPFGQNEAGLLRYIQLGKYLRSSGINYFIYVDILGDKDYHFVSKVQSERNMLWNWVQEEIEAQSAMFDAIIQIPLKEYKINDFTNRREMIKRGQEAFRSQWPTIQRELNM